MDWAKQLRSDLRTRAENWASSGGREFYCSAGGTVLFPETAGAYGNFLPATWAAIKAHPAWQSRLTKQHSRRRALPPERGPTSKEIDSSNSSDALLMNCFCFPNASSRFADLLGATPATAEPQFGVAGVVALRNGRPDVTELDMVIGDTIVEAKLTEGSFIAKPTAIVKRYSALEVVFDVTLLPRRGDEWRGYQLIRNVLAASQHSKRLVVLIDAKRPDLLQEWWSVHAAIADAGLRSRCGVRFWQELAKEAFPEHRAFLETKYGL